MSACAVIKETRVRFGRSATVGFALLAAGSITLTGCSSNSEQTGTPTGAKVSVSGAADLANLVPAAIKSKGVLSIGVAPNYPPNEYVDTAGKIVGWDIDVMNAVAAKLGLKTTYENATFDNIVPGVTTGKYDVGVSSFTDNLTREKSVDFVDYFNAGTQWAGAKGKTVDPDNACGLRVAVQTSTSQATVDVPGRSAKCTAAGKAPIKIQSYHDQAAATTAVVLGKADAVVADSPVIAYGVKQQSDKLQLAGKIYDAAPYGYAIKKGSPLVQAIQKSLEALIADGSYAKICAQWGDQAGAISTPTVNGATG
jgi:polar amino acid transport system substrate-binding protein